MKREQINLFFSSLLLKIIKTVTALALTVTIFILFPALNGLFRADRIMKKDTDLSPKTILMEMTMKKPTPKKVRPKKIRQLSQSTLRSSRSSQSESMKFSPDLALGGGDGVGVEAGGGFEDMIFDEGDTDEPAIIIRQTPIEYPKAAKRARIEGAVEVIFQINREGRVQNIEFTEVPHRMFEKPIRSSLMTRRYKPAMLNGVPVVLRVRQRLNFTLNQ